jgi:hypothetical protein
MKKNEKKVRKTKNGKRKKKVRKRRARNGKKKLFLGDTSELRHGRNVGLKIGAGWRKNLKQKPKKKGLKVFFEVKKKKNVWPRRRRRRRRRNEEGSERGGEEEEEASDGGEEEDGVRGRGRFGQGDSAEERTSQGGMARCNIELRTNFFLFL